MTKALLTTPLIRLETPADIPAIHGIVAQAFGQDAEALLVDRLRENGKFVLSLVATLDGERVGHILYTDMLATAQRLVGLAPLSVLPDVQRRGIGGALVIESLAYLCEQGYDGVIVLGQPDYYPRFGFRRASDFGVRTQFDVPAEHLFALDLTSTGLKPGMVRYQPEFEALVP